MALHRLKTLTVGVVATLILSWTGPVPASDRDRPVWPFRAEPLRVDSVNKRVLIYTEVNSKSLNQFLASVCCRHTGLDPVSRAFGA